LEQDRPEDAWSGEMQGLFRSRYVDLVGGVGYFNVNGDFNETFLTVLAPPNDILLSSISTNLTHTNLYLYSYIKPLSNLTFTLGASGDFTDGDSPDVGNREKFNPNLGSWNLSRYNATRAVFRVLKRT
jgi:hypothetical protein